MPKGCGGADLSSCAGNQVGEAAGPDGPDHRKAEETTEKGQGGQDRPRSRDEVPEMSDSGLHGADGGCEWPVGLMQVSDVVDLCPDLGREVQDLSHCGTGAVQPQSKQNC